MDSSRKSFKTLSMAQPIKKDIDETLNKLELQKRRFLALQRQQACLKEQVQNLRKQYNHTKLIQPKTRVNQNKTNQKSLSINNTDRLYLSTINKISQLKNSIDTERRQLAKYKKLSHNIGSEVEDQQKVNLEMQNAICKKEEENQVMKERLLEIRAINMRNTNEFKHSFNALNRSALKEENQRKKSQIRLTKDFGHTKESRFYTPNEGFEENPDDTKTDLMTHSIPLVKERVRQIIHSNKQKLKISQQYRKFGQDLQNMFQIMKEYKGRDDVQLIAQEFVMKEKQLKKIQQYIGKLENRVMSYQNELEKIKKSDEELKEELSLQTKQNNSQKYYLQQHNHLQKEIQVLEQKQEENTKWLEKIQKIISPLLDGQELNRGNVDKLLGDIQTKYFPKQISQHQTKNHSQNSPSKRTPNGPNIDEKEIKSYNSMQLMSYQRMKEYAKEYITSKK